MPNKANELLVQQRHGFWGKVYVDTAAEARVRPAPDPADTPAVTDPDIAAYLGEIMMAIHPEKRHSPDDDAAREVHTGGFSPGPMIGFSSPIFEQGAPYRFVLWGTKN